jgi:hypothetical protein
MSTAMIAKWYATTGCVRGPTPIVIVNTPIKVPTSANASLDGGAIIDIASLRQA